MNDYKDKLYPSDNWATMDFHEVKRQFYHNLEVASRYVDKIQRHEQYVASRRMMQSMGIR